MFGIHSDPNGPWHHDEASNKTWKVDGVRGLGFLEDLHAGLLAVGDKVALYTHQSEDETNTDWAFVRFGILRDWIDCSEQAKETYILTYTELIDD